MDNYTQPTDTTPTPLENDPSVASPTDTNGIGSIDENLTLDDFDAQVNSERNAEGLPSLDESLGAPVDMGPDLWGPLRDQFEQNPNGIDWLGTLYGLGQSAIYGLGEGVKETAQSAIDFGQKMPGFGFSEEVSHFLARTLFGMNDQDIANRDATRDEMVKEFRDSIPNIAELMGASVPDTDLENVVSTISPLVVSAIMGTQALEGLGVLSRINGMAIPGIAGNALGKVGITGEVVGKSLVGMLDAAASTGIVLDEDLGNFTEMMNGFTDRGDALGSAARVWMNAPTSGAIKDSSDDAATKRFKNALDATFTASVGSLMYLTAVNARTGIRFAKGLIDKSEVIGAANNQKSVEKAIEKLAEAVNGPEALDSVYPTGKAMSGDFTDITNKVDYTPGKPLEGTITADALPPLNPQPSSALDAVTLSPGKVLERIQQATEASNAADRQSVMFMKRFKTLATEVGNAVTSKKFDTEGYFQHLQSATDDKMFSQHLTDYGQFVDNTAENNALLSPKQLDAWNDSTGDVTGNLIASLKRVTSDNPKRKAEAVRFLTRLMGDDPNLADVANKLLDATTESTSEVAQASKILVMSNVYLENTIKPGLKSVVKVLKSAPDDEDVKKQALKILKIANEHMEANKNLRSEAGRLLQSTQIDPQLEQSLKAVYGPKQYQKYFNPLSKVDDVADNTVDDVIDTLDTPGKPLTPSEAAQVRLLERFWDNVEPDQQLAWASNIHHVGQHPVFKRLGQGITFAAELSEQMLMSLTLFHPSTFTRVLTGALSGIVLDSAGGAMFAGKTLGKNSAEILRMGSAYKALTLPYSLWVGAKSFIRPGWQQVYNLGSSVYKHKPILGYEQFAGTFGDDVATKIFTSAGKLPGRILRGVGMGLGFPHHVLGSIETMINHSALSQRVFEALYGGALDQGLTGAKAQKFVFDNMADVMEDAVVAHHVGKGQVALRNKVGLDVEALRGLTKTGDDIASRISLRQTGREAGSDLASTKLADTTIFKAEAGVSKFLSNLPVVGPAAKGALAPFTRVTANMLSRSLEPVQVIMDGATRLMSGGRYSGPSKYVAEALSGLHGPHLQSQMLGNTAISGGLFTLGILNMELLRQQNLTPNYPLGTAAQIEAQNELGVRYGESVLPNGGTLTTRGFAPYVSAWDFGNYADWIANAYGPEVLNPLSDAQNAEEGREHIWQLAQVAAPLAPLYQGIAEVFGSVSNFSQDGGFGTVKSSLSGVASGVGSQIRRPLRIPDLLPGAQTPGKSKAVTSAGISVAFKTALAGASSEPNMYRVNAYGLWGQPLEDKYDPDNKTNQFLEANGFPSYREPETNELSKFMGELESHGITFPAAPTKMNLNVRGANEPVQVNLQTFYNPTTREHLWDVYNRFLRDEKVTRAWVNPSESRDVVTIPEALRLLAKQSLDKERGPDGSKVIRYAGNRSVLLSQTADKMTVLLAGARANAQSKLETYLVNHADEFVNMNGQPLPEYAKIMYDNKKPQVPIPTDSSSLQPIDIGGQQ